MTDNQAVPTELGTEKISKLLKNYAVPAIIAMTASSLYNMVDSIFIGQGVGALAISGLAITFPLMNLSTAFGTLVGVGGATMLSILLGQKNYAAANKVLGNIVTLNILVGLIFMAVALMFLDPILMFFGASENTIGYAREYMQIILAGNAVTHLYFGLNGAMRSSGNPRTAMGLTLFTVIFNTILDPVMIFVLDLGIKGAAWATVLSQTLALIVIMVLFSDKKKVLHFEKGICRFDWRIAKDSTEIGFGPFLMNAASCIVTIFINKQLVRYCGDLGVGAYGINNRLTFLFIMICMGFNQGMQPIAGYNYGARKYKRVIEVYKKTTNMATVIVTSAFLCSVLIPRTLAGIFTHDPELIELSAHGLRIMNCCIWSIGISMIATNLFQSLGMITKSIFLSLVRQLIILVPLLYVLPLFLDGDGVWWSFPISDILAAAIALVMRAKLLRQLNSLNDGDDPAVLGSRM
ncbi:MAG: MATE family efflux transporter [Bacteroidales bacterium]|nr:MATE family efflux transporter [Candidatus Cryptobacteroides caccocaballi]